MKSEPATSPVTQNETPDGEAFAVAHLAQEVPKARRALKRTRIVGTILILAVGAYIGVISTILVGFSQPKEAAQVASGVLVQHVKSEGPALAAQVEREIPLLIRQAPDYLIKEIPGYRKELQQALETEYQAYCNSLSRDLDDQIDKLIDDHKAEIKTLLANANDREAIRKTLPDFDQVIAEFAKNDVDGRAVKSQIHDLAATLKEVEKRMDRLANASDLTAEEQKARRALAMLAKVIQDNSKTPEAASKSVTTLWP